MRVAPWREATSEGNHLWRVVGGLYEEGEQKTHIPVARAEGVAIQCLPTVNRLEEAKW